LFLAGIIATKVVLLEKSGWKEGLLPDIHTFSQIPLKYYIFFYFLVAAKNQTKDREQINTRLIFHCCALSSTIIFNNAPLFFAEVTETQTSELPYFPC
jgi:hypothetical protein